MNIDEYLKRLIELSKTLSFEEERSVREGLTEEELAIFDLLTQPEPVLTDEERERVKSSAKKLLEHLHEKLIQDWRRKIDVLNDVDSTIRRVLDWNLPEEPYTPDIFNQKVGLVLEHVLTAYGDNGESAYTTRADVVWPNTPIVLDGPLDPAGMTYNDVQAIRENPELAASVSVRMSSGTK